MRELQVSTINNNARKFLKLTIDEYIIAEAIYVLSTRPNTESSIPGANGCSVDKIGDLSEALSYSIYKTNKIIRKLQEKGIITVNKYGYISVTPKWYDNHFFS